jgi:deoxyribodipyrimidine photolyase-related protein
VDAALMSYQRNQLELSTVEGFIRQILGWREFVRGVYFLDMPKLATDNHFKHTNPLPQWYWTGQSRMKCMSDSVGQTIQYGYAHHIQRLMVTGNFALLAEILPQEVAQWYLAMYVDAVEWVELPNVAGMALFANGGRFTSKPYVASGMYIKRMSNYCQSCPYKPDLKHGGDACPVTVLYWNFLIKHQESFSKNPRTSLMVRNLSKVSTDDQLKIQDSATRILGMLDDI